MLIESLNPKCSVRFSVSVLVPNTAVFGPTNFIETTTTTATATTARISG